ARQDIDEIERTGAPLRELRLRSPADGRVIERKVVRGAYVMPGAPLFTIADLSTVWVQADVYERDLGRIREGQDAVLSLGAAPDESLPAKATCLAPPGDPATRTLKVRTDLPIPKGRLRPGMAGDVTLRTDDGAEALMVPAEAVIDTGALAYVFLV